jgi:predicted HAD superfamily Cof-like phosphohydrolase
MNEQIDLDCLNEMFGYSFQEHFGMNKQTMDKVEQTTSNKLRTPTPEERTLRAQLIYEEAMETIEALGIEVWPSNGCAKINPVFINMGDVHYNPKEVLDGVADLAVVANGTLLCCGLHEVFPEALKRVDENNWSKVKDGVIRNADGKYQKPPGYKPVVLDDLIERVTCH